MLYVHCRVRVVDSIKRTIKGEPNHPAPLLQLGSACGSCSSHLLKESRERIVLVKGKRKNKDQKSVISDVLF